MGKVQRSGCHRPLPRLSQPRNRRAKHLTRHWTRRWKIRVPKYPKRRIRQLSRGRPPKRNTIERTTIMVVGGSLSDFSLGASYANKAIQLLADNSARRDVCFIWPAEKPSRVLLARKPATSGLSICSPCGRGPSSQISDSGCCSSETGRHKGRKRRVHDANCMGCHDTGIYTRKDRLVQSLDALKKRLGDCSHMANKEFSASETQNIIKYLNYQFYQFR